VSFTVELEDEQVEFTTRRNMGFDTLRVTFSRDLQRRRAYERSGLARVIAGVRGREHVEVWAGRVVWEGQLVAVERDSGQPSAIEARGYHAALQEVLFRTGAETDAVLPARDIVFMAARHLPWLTAHPNDVPGPLATYPIKDFHELPVGDVIERLVRQGDGDGVAWSLYVYEGPRLAVRRETEPEQPTYIALEYQEKIMFEPMITRVSVQYEVEGSAVQSPSGRSILRTPVLINHAQEADTGRPIERIVQAGKISRISAARYAAYLLEHHAAPTYTARVSGESLLGYGGVPIVPHLVRSGEWVRVGSETYVIARTTYRHGKVEVELASPWPTETEAFRVLVESVNRLQRRQLPLAGGRW
jgi:hypothetical protein